jgi:hypothetical protein
MDSSTDEVRALMIQLPLESPASGHCNGDQVFNIQIKGGHFISNPYILLTLSTIKWNAMSFNI